MDILAVPAEFQPPYPGYPGWSKGPTIEMAFSQYAAAHRDEIQTELVYLPIHWWSLTMHNRKISRSHDFLADPRAQAFIDTNLRPDRRYFTVSQCDDGVYERLPPNVLVFSAGGMGDIPIPLLCDPHPRHEMPRDVRCCFLGATECGGPATPRPVGRSSWDPDGAGARLRRAMFTAVQGTPGWDLRNQTGNRAQHVQEFRHMLCRSIFCLCPRGYGRTSFRLYEAIQCGCIPVYLWDDRCWLPYQDVLEWDTFSLLCPLSELVSLRERVNSASPEWVAAAQQRLRALYEPYFTLAGAARQIARMVTERSGWQR